MKTLKFNLNRFSMNWSEKDQAEGGLVGISRKPADYQQNTSIKLRSVLRYAAMLVMLLTLGVGQMWGVWRITQ